MAWVASTSAGGQQLDQLRPGWSPGCCSSSWAIRCWRWALASFTAVLPAARRRRASHSSRPRAACMRLLGLVPHQAGRAVDDLGGHLLPAVGGQAVEEDRPGAARAIRARRRPGSRRTRPRARRASASWPIETHTSVQTASAPATASAGSSVTTRSPPRPRPRRRRPGRAGSPAGRPAGRPCRPARRPRARLRATLLPSPTQATRPPGQASPSAGAGSAGRPGPGRDGPRSERRLTTGTTSTRGHLLEHAVVEDPGADDARGSGQHPDHVLDRSRGRRGRSPRPGWLTGCPPRADDRHLGGVAGPVRRLLEDQGHPRPGQDRGGSA